jgi:uncharacterized hydrophobic protein (TIGR00271 family)
VLHLRLYCPDASTPAVLEVLTTHRGVSNVAMIKAGSVRPAGDLLLADVTRVVANDLLAALVALGVHRVGTVQLEPVPSWISQDGFDLEQGGGGPSSADAVVWPDVVQKAYDESELNWTYASFMVLATLIAGIAIILDSQILVIGAMVLGPEFGPVAAMSLALVRRRKHLFTQALGTLVIGFALAILATTLATLLGRALGWVTLDTVIGPRPGTAFIYHPDKWAVLVSLIAGAAGVLSLTSARTGGLSGVFISVTTVPAASNVALGLAFGVTSEIWGSTLQLVINIIGMAFAGWATLSVQQAVWSRVSRTGRDGDQPTIGRPSGLR